MMAISGTIVECVRCSKRKLHYARGLCSSCFHSCDITKFSKFQRGNGGLWDEVEEPARKPKPTDAAPGTEAKIAELARRFKGRMELWHPDDSREHSAAEDGMLDSFDDGD